MYHGHGVPLVARAAMLVPTVAACVCVCCMSSSDSSLVCVFVAPFVVDCRHVFLPEVVREMSNGSSVPVDRCLGSTDQVRVIECMANAGDADKQSLGPS